jgi:two-component system sensor histidine kinase CpxA
MRRLFVKIFLWFWATVIGSAIALALTFRLGPEAVPTRYHIAWAFALLVSGGICYALTRYLTVPVLRLRVAARLLADGELTARAADVKPRRDEIGDLVRDFNVMADRLEDLVMSQRQLISDISHELRSPLARVNATIGLARQRLGQDVLFDRMERDAERLNEMIGRLLTLARLEATRLPEMRPTDLNALVAEIVADAQWEAGQRKCRVDLVSDGSCEIHATPDLLRSAVENVIGNAIRYTASGTSIEVQLSCRNDADGGEAVIRVSDRGPGVPSTELPNIFHPFYRVDEARDRESGGVGLGLAIADRVARFHGGSVHAENRIGGGLEVVLTLKT